MQLDMDDRLLMHILERQAFQHRSWENTTGPFHTHVNYHNENFIHLQPQRRDSVPLTVKV